jgi:hypothetical protein
MKVKKSRFSSKNFTKKHLCQKFEQSSIFTKKKNKNDFYLLFTPDFLQEISKFQSVRYINPAQMMKSSKDLKSEALKTADISSIHISSNEIWQRRVTGRNCKLVCNK